MTTLTLAQQLQPSSITVEQLRPEYNPMFELVKQLLGVVPNCESLMAIWPPSLRSYNLLVPNALNLPLTLWGMGAPKDKISLAMHFSSRASGCAYCTAHTCTFALRRGTRSEALFGERDAQEVAVIAVAEALGTVPCDLTADDVQQLHYHFSPADAEWIVIAVAMMGFLNKFMDAVGVELETSVLAETSAMLTPIGWSAGKHRPGYDSTATQTKPIEQDNIRTYLRLVQHAPGAVRTESRWTKGVPDKWPHVGNYLRQQVGHDFPVLSRLSHKRFVRALTTIIRDNFDQETTALGLPLKAMTGYLYAHVVGNEPLASEMQGLLATVAPDQVNERLDVVKRVAEDSLPTSPTGLNQLLDELEAQTRLSRGDVAAIVLSRAAATSPAAVSPIIIDHVGSQLSHAAVIELMTWLSVSQMLHRLDRYFSVAETSS